MDEPKHASRDQLPTAEHCDSSSMTAYSPPQGADSDSSFDNHEYVKFGVCSVLCPPPYVVGSTFTAMLHEPPAPFGHNYITKNPELPENRENLSQLDNCFSRPSLGGRSVTHITKTLTITAVIRSGYGRGAQILIMDQTMVAKIFDPLYYQFNEYGNTEPVISNADGDYLREAAAYTELQSSPAAVQAIPIYYGSFTIDIETPASLQGRKRKRSVPLILIEHLRGETMSNIKPKKLPDEVRSAILKKALIADAIIEHAGVRHNDYCPRNIIILNFDHEVTSLTSEYVGEHMQIKVIDFNVATAVRHPSCKFRHLFVGDNARRRKLGSGMLSPIVTYHSQMMEFYDWIPRGGMTAEQWLWQQFHDDDRFCHVILCSNKRPKYVGS